MAPMYQCGWTMWLFNTLKNPLQAAGFLRAASIILDESQNKRPNEPSNVWDVCSKQTSTYFGSPTLSEKALEKLNIIQP